MSATRAAFVHSARSGPRYSLPVTTTRVLDIDGFDPTTRPQDDLFRHVNGSWLATVQIPDDKPATGAFQELRDAAEEAVRDIITSVSPDSSDPDERRIADLYASFMDQDKVEAAGAGPLQPPLARIDAVDSPTELLELVGGLGRRGVAGLFGWDVDSDPGNPQREIVMIGQGGLGLPDEEYYRADGYADTRTAYVEHIATSFGLAGVGGDEPQAMAQQVFDLETKIAGCHWDKVRTRDLRQMYNPMTFAELTGSAPGLDWPAWLTGYEIDEALLAEVVNAQPSFFTDVAVLVTGEPIAAWRAWAKWKVISSLSPYLASAFVNERFHFYGTILNGTPKLKERWKRGVDLVEGSIGEAVGKVYVEQHFPDNAKERMDELVANLIEAYRRSINELDWMTDETRAKALDKLSKFAPMIGFPQAWRDYSALVIEPDDLIGNVMRAASFEINRNLAKVGKPVDRGEWLMTPQTVNAYYHPLRNVIVFPAAILQPPFFHADADDAVNYGGIGAVIGHEIGHGFDDQGSTCDGDGALVNWWTDADRKAFDTRTRSLIDQYSALAPNQTPDHHVNGELTIGENIGDLGGLSIAFLAWKIAQEGNEVGSIDGYSGEQRLFLSWATVWQTKMRDEAMIQRLAVDPHSPAEFRCNQTVRNVPEFYAAFEVAERDDLWLPEEQRVKIW